MNRRKRILILVTVLIIIALGAAAMLIPGPATSVDMDSGFATAIFEWATKYATPNTPEGDATTTARL